MIFTLVFICTGSAAGMWAGLIFIYVDAYLGMGDQFAELYLMAFVFGVVVAPVWHHVAMAVGKKTALFIVALILVFDYSYTAFLTPGNTSFTQLLVLKSVQTCAFSGGAVLVPAMLAELVDYAHWKTGNELSATYFSIKVFLEKTASALGAGLALAIAGSFGFVVSADTFSAEAVTGLTLAMAWIPTFLSVLSLVFVVLLPINERRHAIIRRRLDSNLARSTMMASAKIDNVNLLNDPKN